MVSFKIISIDSSVNNNNNKLCIEKLDASIDFHIAIMKKNQEEYVSTASILFKVMAFDQFISNTGILRDLLSRRLHAKCLSGKYKITYCSRYPARLSSEQKEKYANQILVFNQLNSDTVYYKLRNCNQHLNGPNFCSASLDLLLKLLSDNLTNFSYSLQVLHKVDGLFAITDMFHLIWLNEKPTGLFPKLDIQERGVKRYGINQLKKIVDVFEKTLLLACGAGSFVPDAFQSNGVNTNDRNQLNLAQENVDYLFDGDNSFYFNIKAKWIDLLVEKLHENAPNAVFLLLSVKLFLFFAHQSQYQFNSEPLDQHLKSKSYNHVIISLSQLNEALGRFVYLLSQSNLVDQKNMQTKLTKELKDYLSDSAFKNAILHTPVNINFSNQRTVEFHGGNRNGETVSVQGLADSLELHSFLNPNFNAKKDRKTCYFFDIVNSIRYGMDEIFNQILGELTGGV